MNKEEILEKSRKENKDSDEMEIFALTYAGKIASKVGMLVCCFVAVLQVIFKNSISYESWMIYFSVLGAMFIVKYIKLRYKYELIMGILYCSLFVFFTVLFINRLVS